jgi:acetyltransferase-like isoleucine patch superfamily enzyme
MLNKLKFLIGKGLKKSRLSFIRDSFIHPTSKVESGTSFVSSVLGKYSFCGYDCDIHKCIIGNFTSIANQVVIGGATHPMNWVSMSPVFYSGRDSIKKKFSKNSRSPDSKTIIGNDVWIGRNVIVLSGVIVGDGAVLGAGSIVTKNVPPYAIVAGNPAKIIRYRFNKNIIKGLQLSQWWHWDDAKLLRFADHIKYPIKFIRAQKSIFKKNKS